ncbi:MAG: MFS transporter [Acidobacteriota bacterium]
MERRALAAVCAAGFAFSANYTNHAPMVPALQGEFGFNQASAGLLTTGIFLTHALMQVPGGRLADRLGAARVLAAALAWVTAGNFAIAFAGAWWQLLLWKVFVGIGTGACFAAGESTVLAAKPTVPGSLEIAVYRDGVRREVLHSAGVPAGLFLLPWKPKTAGDYVLRWTFGDGNNSTQQNPVHQYVGTGPFTVQLEAINAVGSSFANATISFN